MAFWRTKAAISLKCVKIEEKLLWRAQKELTNALSNGTVPDPIRPPFPKIQTPNFGDSLLSQERVNLRTLNFVRIFEGSIETEAHEKFWEK